MVSRKIIVFIIGLFSFANFCHSQELEQLVAQVNAMCPISMGQATGEVISSTIEDSYVVWVYSINEQFTDISAMDEEKAKKAFYLNVRTNANSFLNDLLKAINERKYGFVQKFIGKTSGKTCIITFSAEEIAALSDNIGTDDNPNETLAAMVESWNAQYPMKMNDFLTMRKVTIEEDYLVYNASVDETVENVSVRNLQNSKETLKENITNSLMNDDPTIDFVAKLCLKCNKGIAYRYEGTENGNVCVIEIPFDELTILVLQKQFNKYGKK